MLSKRRKLIGVLVLAAWIGSGVAWLSTGPSHDGPIRLEVSLSERELRVVEGDSTVATYGVAVGRPSYPTPTGTFETGDIVWNPSWTPPPSGWAANKSYQPPGAAANPMQAVKIYFRAPDLYIHGTNDPGSIGEAASHGCIRMTPEDASELAHRIEDAGGHVPLTISP
ncbi:MAG TPA: L,D-transpeptidase [Gemmatimonadaceae bacterium]